MTSCASSIVSVGMPGSGLTMLKDVFEWFSVSAGSMNTGCCESGPLSIVGGNGAGRVGTEGIESPEDSRTICCFVVGLRPMQHQKSEMMGIVNESELGYETKVNAFQERNICVEKAGSQIARVGSAARRKQSLCSRVTTYHKESKAEVRYRRNCSKLEKGSYRLAA
jgi:hypothetical protein